MLLLLFLPGRAVANQHYREDTLSLDIYFLVNESSIEYRFEGNGARIKEFVKEWKALKDRARVQEIVVNGSVSPEGPAEFNRGLAERRAHNLGRYIAHLTGIEESLFQYDIQDNTGVAIVGDQWEQYRRAGVRMVTVTEEGPETDFQEESQLAISQVPQPEIKDNTPDQSESDDKSQAVVSQASEPESNVKAEPVATPAPKPEKQTKAQADTLSLDVYFQQNASALEREFRGNGERMEEFRAALVSAVQEPGVLIRTIIVRAAASPEGTPEYNRNLSQDRARSLGTWLTDTLGVNPGLIWTDAVGADWEGLTRLLEGCDEPWKDEALNIVRNGRGNDRKKELQALRDGEAWSWMSRNLFPELRFAKGTVSCIIASPAQQDPVRDTVYIKTQTTVTDTVFVGGGITTLTPEVVKAYEKERRKADFTGKKMIFAVRTNALAVPLANIGVEVPIGKRWSVGIDYYYPWIWRPHHAEGLDYSGKCFELQALDIEGRYWFAPRKSNQPAQRLLGHSVGLYAAVGHYDFEQNFSGHQGEFYNVGVDYLYACPIFGGRLHLEFELGIGYIYSPSQPYDTFVPGEKAFRRKGVTQYTRWFGPTRAQVSLVWPIYVNVKKGGAR